MLTAILLYLGIGAFLAGTLLRKDKDRNWASHVACLGITLTWLPYLVLYHSYRPFRNWIRR